MKKKTELCLRTPVYCELLERIRKMSHSVDFVFLTGKKSNAKKTSLCMEHWTSVNSFLQHVLKDLVVLIHVGFEEPSLRFVLLPRVVRQIVVHDAGALVRDFQQLNDCQ
jgi:hypothetical protein